MYRPSWGFSDNWPALAWEVLIGQHASIAVSTYVYNCLHICMCIIVSIYVYNCTIYVYNWQALAWEVLIGQHCSWLKERYGLTSRWCARRSICTLPVLNDYILWHSLSTFLQNQSCYSRRKAKLPPYLLDWHAEGLSGRIEWKTSCELWHLDTYKYQVKYGTGILVKCRTWTHEMYLKYGKSVSNASIGIP